MPQAIVQLTLASSAGPQLASTAASFKTVSAEQSRAEQGALRYATAVQRLTLAQARVATESQRYAIQTANVARAQTQAESAALRLSTAQARVGSSSGAAAQFTDGLKSGLLGIVGPAALATAALGALISTANNAKAGFALNAQLEQNAAAISIQLRGIRDSGAAFDEAAAFANKYKLTQLETSEAIQASVGVLRNSSAGVGDVMGVLARLQILSPEQSLQEAALAVKELQSGDITSLSKRFEISRSSANKMKAEINDGTDAIVVLGKYLDSVGVSMDTLGVRTEGTFGKMKELKVESEKLSLALGGAGGGIGLALVETQISATQKATQLLTNDIAGLRVQTISEQLQTFFGQTKAQADATAISVVNFTGKFDGVVPAVAAAAQGTGAYDAQLQALNASLVVNKDALTAGAQKALDSKIATAALADEQARLEADSWKAANGMLGAGDQALNLAKKYGITTREAEFLIAAQSRIADGAGGPKSKHITDDAGGLVGGMGDALTKAGGVAAAAAKKADAEAARLQDARDRLALARATTSAQKIAELKRQQARTSDPVEKLQLQAQIEQELQSNAKSRTGELGKQLKLNEGIYDSVEKQRDALLDIEELAIRDRQQDREDAQKIKTARAILASPNASADMKARAQDALALIDVQDRKRANELAGKGATANASIVNGKLLQSLPGGALPVSTGASTLGALPSPGAAPGGAGGAAGLTINLVCDGKTLASVTEPHIMDALMSAVRGGRATIGA